MILVQKTQSQLIKLSKYARIEVVNIPNFFPDNKYAVLIHLHGIVESENFHDEQEFVVEYKATRSDPKVGVLPGWIIFIIGHHPPGLWFLEWIFPS